MEKYWSESFRSDWFETSHLGICGFVRLVGNRPPEDLPSHPFYPILHTSFTSLLIELECFNSPAALENPKQWPIRNVPTFASQRKLASK